MKHAKKRAKTMLVVQAAIGFIAFAVLMSGLVGIYRTSSIPYEDGNITVYMCPEDKCEEVIIKELNSAENYIHCAFYNLALGSIRSALENKSASVEVEVVTGRDRKSRRGIMHNKFCVIDGEEVITGSANPTKSINCDLNNVVIVNSRIIAQNYESEFKELDGGIFGGGNKTKITKVNLSGVIVENYFCPEDGCEAVVADMIAKAKENVKFMTFSFTSRIIGNELLKHPKAKVEGIFEKSQISKYSQYIRLGGFIDNCSCNMHHKVFIVDDTIVETGSYNPTANGNRYNDENILIIRDKGISRRFAEEFESIKERYVSL